MTKQPISDIRRMPVLFLGHGNPMNAIVENQFVEGFRKVAQLLPKPSSILCVSAHWTIRGTRVTATESPRTIHDFGGFPQQLYEVQYPAPGNPQLVNRTRELLLPSLVEPDEHWGLDHGAWTVIKHLYPKADIPVIQLSIDYSKDAAWHFQLAQKLSQLRNEGVLIIGSGNIIHNLSLIDFRNLDLAGYGYDWAIEARETINTHLLDGNFQALINYRNLSGAIQLAIPTPEHYIPMLFALGLKQPDEAISIFNDELVAGSLSMTSFMIG